MIDKEHLMADQRVVSIRMTMDEYRRFEEAARLDKRPVSQEILYLALVALESKEQKQT